MDNWEKGFKDGKAGFEDDALYKESASYAFGYHEGLKERSAKALRTKIKELEGL